MSNFSSSSFLSIFAKIFSVFCPQQQQWQQLRNSKKSSLPRSFPLLSVEFALLCFLLFFTNFFFALLQHCPPDPLSFLFPHALPLLVRLLQSWWFFVPYFLFPWLVLGRPLHRLPAPASEGNTAPTTTTRFLLSLSLRRRRRFFCRLRLRRRRRRRRRRP